MSDNRYHERIDPLAEKGKGSWSEVNRNAKRSHIERYRLGKRVVTGRVLDAGCGLGYGTGMLSESPAVEFVVGVDISPEAVKYADNNYTNPGKNGFIVGDCEQLDRLFEADVFDSAVSFEVIEHLNDPLRFLHNAGRVIKKGGLFLVSTPLKENLHYGSDGKPENPFHVAEYTEHEMRDMLRETGFALKDIYAQDLFLGPFAKIIGQGLGGSGKGSGVVKNLLKEAFNAVPFVPDILAKPYKCPGFLRKTGIYAVYVTENARNHA